MLHRKNRDPGREKASENTVDRKEENLQEESAHTDEPHADEAQAETENKTSQTDDSTGENHKA